MAALLTGAIRASGSDIGAFSIRRLAAGFPLRYKYIMSRRVPVAVPARPGFADGDRLTMRARLVPADGGNPIDIVKDLTLVGRREDCDLRLDHKSVSKTHCVIVKTDGMLMLRDLGSTNGTRVNGQRVRRAMLLPADQLHIATYRFTVQFGPDVAPP